MNLRALGSQVNGLNLSIIHGYVERITVSNIIGRGLGVSIGDIVTIKSINSDMESYGMVVQLEKDSFFVSPFSFLEGFKIGDYIYLNDNNMSIPVGEELLGRVVDPFMKPIDDGGAIITDEFEPIMKKPISVLKRGIIDERFNVGIKSIDGLLTCGKGQKLGIFAGSGVGKSTTLSMIVKGCDAPVKVIALIGERGREVPEFIYKSLGGDLTNTVIVVATSDDSSLMRKYGAFSAMSVAEFFKNQGRDVLFIMDSVTRFAMAQREIGLSLGEPPTSKGYPPSSLTILAQLMERAGKEEGKGSITAFFTVLVEGDDLTGDPIADQSRSILDGHIVLSRELTETGIYPPVSVLNSASRVIGDVIGKEHRELVQRFRKYYSLLKENEVLIKIGSYTGGDKDLDYAISVKESMDEFLKQGGDEHFSYEDTVEKLEKLFH